jgi:hypothetical protein
VSNGTSFATQAGQHGCQKEFLNPRIIVGSKENTMFGYGIIGTIVVICLVVWLVRAL